MILTISPHALTLTIYLHNLDIIKTLTNLLEYLYPKNRSIHSKNIIDNIYTKCINKILKNGIYVSNITFPIFPIFSDHSIILDKLYYYGIRGSVVNLFSSYLTNLHQSVI